MVEQLARPITAVRSAGFTSRKAAMFDPLNFFLKSQIPSLKTTKEPTIEDTIKSAEKKILDLIDESYIAESTGDYPLALAKAKEASSKEHSLIRMLEQTGHNDNHNFELTFCVLFAVAHQYVKNKMYVEALNMYQAITKNKIFQNGSRLKINMGNIYARLGQYHKAIKVYRWVLDHIPNANKELRLKIMHNIGIIFVKMKRFDEASLSFEYILQEKLDIKTSYHCIICYFLMSNRHQMKKGFQTILDSAETIDTSKKFESLHIGSIDDDSQVQVIENDQLQVLQKAQKKKVERSILTTASILSHTVDDTYASGYNWCIEMIKNSQYCSLSVELEISQGIMLLKQDNINSAMEVLKSFNHNECTVMSAVSTNLSFIYFLKGDINVAEQHGSQARNANVYSAFASVNVGNCMLLGDEFEKAKDCYIHALENDSLCIEALYNLGLLYKHTGKLEESLDYFLKLQTIIANCPDVLYQIGRLYELLNDNDQSTEWYLQLLGVIPSDSTMLQRLADMFDNDNDKQQALNYYMEIYRQYPSNITTLDWLGSYFMESHLPQKAIMYFKKASLVQPKEPRWRLLVGSCYYQSGNYTAATQIYKSIHGEFPESTDYAGSLEQMIIGPKPRSRKTKYSGSNTSRESSSRQTTPRFKTPSEDPYNINDNNYKYETLRQTITRPMTRAGKDKDISDSFTYEDVDALLPQ